MRDRMAVLEINPMLVLEFPLQALQHEIVEIVAPQLVVSVAGQDFGDVALDAYDRHVKGPAAKVVNHGGVMRRVAETVREAGGGRLIEDAYDFQTGKLASLAGGVALSVRKVGRYGNDGSSDRLMESLFSPLHQLAKNQRGNLLGREFLVRELHRLGRLYIHCVPRPRIEGLPLTGNLLNVELRQRVI